MSTGNGCIVFVVDESHPMKSAIAEGAKSRSEVTVTALNSLLKQLGNGPDVDLAIVGYGPEAGIRWGGALEGREFVQASELADNPVAVEDRISRRPDPSSPGSLVETTVSFPIWYNYEAGGDASLGAALEIAARLLTDWVNDAGPDSGPPLIVHITGSHTPHSELREAIQAIKEVAHPAGAPLFFQAYLGSQTTAMADLYPSNRMYLKSGPVRDLFEQSSLLPATFATALRGAKLTIQAQARGLVFNGRFLDLVKFLALAKEYAKDPQSATVEAEALPDAPAVRTLSAAVLAPPPPPPGAAVPPPEPEEQTAPEPVVEAEEEDAGEADTIALESEPVVEEEPVEDAGDTEATETFDLEPAEDDGEESEETWSLESDEVADDDDSDDETVSLSEADDEEAESLEDSDDADVIADEVTDDAAAPEPSGDFSGRAAIVVLIDRSVSEAEPDYGVNPCEAFCDHANRLLQELARRKEGAYDVALVTYGTDSGGQAEVQSVFDTGFVNDTDLVEAAVRVDEVEVEVFDGIGGLREEVQQHPIFIEPCPSDAGDVGAAFAKAAELVTQWQAAKGSDAPAVVLHMTRGAQDPGTAFDVSSALLYHLIVTEAAHSCVVYPDSTEKLSDPTLESLWEITSPLRRNEELAEEKSYVKPESRGIVVNGQFDLLLNSLAEA
jgi:hypothetical protein